MHYDPKRGNLFMFSCIFVGVSDPLSSRCQFSCHSSPAASSVYLGHLSSCQSRSRHDSFLKTWGSTHIYRSCSPAAFTTNQTIFSRHFSQQAQDDNSEVDKPESSKGIMQRFKDAYKEYGKVLICVHLATSAVWISGFYYAAYRLVADIFKLSHGGAAVLLPGFAISW